MKAAKCYWWFKHKIENVEGKGFRCVRCGKPKTQCKEATYEQTTKKKKR